MSDCEICGEYLHADEEWRLTPGLIPGSELQGNYGDREGPGYVHARCIPAGGEQA